MLKSWSLRGKPEEENPKRQYRYVTNNEAHMPASVCACVCERCSYNFIEVWDTIHIFPISKILLLKT